MSLPDAAEARRISAQLATLEQQRAQGTLPHGDTPLRLYRVQTGGFVRVLDGHPEPISQGMLETIDAFMRKSEERGGTEEMKTAGEGRRRDFAELRADGAEQSKLQQEVRDNVAAAAKTGDGGVAMTAPADGDVEKTQTSGSVGVEIAPPWESAIPVKTPQELLAQNERASDWLGKNLGQNSSRR
ncbi:hypothetical protein KRP22_012451 [Phytophthora ramorum]|nr:hypothetical protein KRP22_13151 [Phytophthora ramorum]